MCEDCKGLVDAGASTPPHDELSEFLSRNLSGSPEPAGMRNFTCSHCGQQWVLYTPGGWVAQG
jgi:hypothetical protein